MTMALRYSHIPAPEKPKVHGIAALTMRDREVMAAVIEHGSYLMAAHHLGCSTAAVKMHLSKVRENLDCATTAQAAVVFDRWMREQGAAE